MTLLERATQAEGELASLKDLDQRRTEVEKLEGRRIDFERALKALQACASLIQEYRTAKIPIQLDLEPAQGLRERIGSVASAFSAAPLAETLTTGRRWTGLLTAMEKVTTNYSAAARSAWQTFVDGECAAESPDAIEQKLAPTVENQAALGRYREAYRALMDRITRPARLAADVENVRSALRELRGARGTFSFDCPADVAAFLRAAHSPSGAPVESLTKNVLSWLQEHRMLSQFTIRSRT